MNAATRGAHYTPNNRPIHPRCTAEELRECRCERLHDYWDGSPEYLARQIEVGERMESRTRLASSVSPSRGAGPDDDGTDYHRGMPEFDATDVRAADFEGIEAGGYWRETENKRTIAGPTYKGHDDGLDHSRDFHIDIPVRRGQPC